MKRVFIIHGWGEYHNKGWFPWLKGELAKRGFKAKVPVMMPQPPILEKWIQIVRIKVKGKKHFSHEEGINKLPEALNAVLEMVK